MQHMSSRAGRESEPEPLGVGATLLSSLFALLVGGVVGIITTFTHRQFLPWGLVGGLLVVLALVIGFRLVFDSRVVGAAAAIGVIAGSALLTLPGAGGSAFVVSGLPGWTWALGPAILSAIALVWPRPRVRAAAASEPVALAE
jgi:N-acetyl-1-D-myo-inositol-2-amino-2-deoxy-alpha-D-glucopyranoside deacetylase